MDIVSRDEEQMTEPRCKASADIRHASSIITAKKLVSNKHYPALNVNSDGTSYTVGGKHIYVMEKQECDAER